VSCGSSCVESPVTARKMTKEKSVVTGTKSVAITTIGMRNKPGY
jgi:hypothetical protein